MFFNDVRLKILHLEPLETRRFKMDLILLHKIILGEIQVDSHLIPIFNKTCTRNYLIQQPKSLNNVYYYSFFNRAIRAYNKLPNILKNQGTISSFRNELNSLDLHQILM